MKFVRSLTEGTVVTANHVIHADRATPFVTVPEELLALSRRTPPKVAITDDDPFVMQAEGIVVPRTKNGVRAGGPTAEELAAAEEEERKRQEAEEEEARRRAAEEEEAERRQQEANAGKTAGAGKAGSKGGAKAGGKSGK